MKVAVHLTFKEGNATKFYDDNCRRGKKMTNITTGCSEAKLCEYLGHKKYIKYLWEERNDITEITIIKRKQ